MYITVYEYLDAWCNQIKAWYFYSILNARNMQKYTKYSKYLFIDTSFAHSVLKVIFCFYILIPLLSSTR